VGFEKHILKKRTQLTYTNYEFYRFFMCSKMTNIEEYIAGLARSASPVVSGDALEP
jgi:hypothetical protein